jgi:hypothetical protein
MSVQTSYDNVHAEGFVGQMADLQLTNVLSRNAEASVIDFGLAVVRGTADDQCKLATATGGSFLGLTVRTIAGTADAAGDRKYQINESVNILDEGTIYAICEDGCVPGNPVSFRYVAGTGQVGGLRTVAVTAETDVIANAVWDTTTAAGAIGRVKFK